MTPEQKSIVEAAREEARKMREAITACEGREDARVTLTMEQFTKLADMIDDLSHAVDYWPEETLDDPRYWVPLGHFQRVQAEVTRWQGECGRLAQDQRLHDLLRFES
jgi:enoyl-[acyl-carrier-protein] reductase (NADH)